MDVVEVRRRWQHMLRDGADWDARRAVTECAAAMKMPGAELDEIAIVERRRRDRHGAQLD